MVYRTPYQIAAINDQLVGLANTRAINRLFRAQDESHLAPVHNQYNATERAIRQSRKIMHDCGEPCEGLTYALTIDDTLSRIINSHY